MVDSITSALGAGSGIDIKALVDSLVDAQFSSKNAMLDTRETAIKAQISAAGELKSAISGFSSALATLARSGSLSTQPTSSDTGVVRASQLTGSSAAGLSATVEVRQIASAQASNSNLVTDTSADLGGGKLTLTFGSAQVSGGQMTGFTAGAGTPVEITIDPAASKLSDIAAAINAKKAGVTASIIGDANGSRLVLKGATGESQGFTLSADTAGLAAVEVGVGKGNIGTAAQDAIVVVDGVQIQRASNSIGNLLPGVRLDLVSARPGTTVQLGSTPSSEGLSQAVQDFAETYNQLQALLKTATDPVGGALRADPAARTMKIELSRLVGAQLIDDPSGPRTLAEIGVATLRDGTLSVDAAKLATALSRYPQAVESMFAAGAALPAALQKISQSASDTRTGLGASEASYTKQVEAIAEQREKALEAAEATRTRMTQQFASMDAKVAAYKSTQTFLQQQVDAWNSQNN
ncbi:flagellar hook protein [Sphingomonas spermidinifaciens]|uniref:Flagellar hook-associated protein 2 n=1 Tax=Sphingomonas spermidinifaciens TaxID=1141889 RepID=A0A2A4B6H8_9SPHN|nr:flagellar filament capping protein FliD [Sphingomonas spermidinifaciens]PCD04061.1 flagellar hook protein [Sphingomonas spermidinifaciens]